MSLLLLLACGGPTDAPDVSPPLERAPGERANPHAAPTPSPSGAPPMIAAGDVTHEGAQIWLRAEPAAIQRGAPALVLAGRTPWEKEWKVEAPAPTEESDWTSQIALAGLPPDSEIFYEVLVGEASASGRFRTAPAPEQAGALSFAVMGDLGGQGHCRLAEGGYPVMSAIAALEPTLLIGNGDMIYADGDCPELSPDGLAQIPGGFSSIADVDWTDAAAVRENLSAHWRYNRSDPGLQALLSRAALYAQWDDHEVVNDFGAAWDRWHSGEPERPGYAGLVAEGRAATLRYNPIQPNAAEPGRIYRSFRWGETAELFFLDARSYRSPNTEPDGPEKTMLGEAQRAWLVEGLLASDASWKIVSADVPISIPTGSMNGARDGWASGEEVTGFERELSEILTALDRGGVQNLVFVTTDVHRARTIRYRYDGDGDGAPLIFHELVSGPLRAWRGEPAPLDPTFGPESLYAEGGIDNFAWVEIDEGGALRARVVGVDGQARPGSELTIRAEGS